MVRWELSQRLRHRIFGAACTSHSDITELLERVWIERIWTFQELLLSSHPVLVCGNNHISWAQLVWALLFVGATSKVRDPGDRMSTCISTWLALAFARIRLLPPRSSQPATRSNEDAIFEPSLHEISKYLKFTGKMKWYQSYIATNLLGLLVFALVLCSIAPIVFSRLDFHTTVLVSVAFFVICFVLYGLILSTFVVRPTLDEGPTADTHMNEDPPRSESWHKKLPIRRI